MSFFLYHQDLEQILHRKVNVITEDGKYPLGLAIAQKDVPVLKQQFENLIKDLK